MAKLYKVTVATHNVKELNVLAESVEEAEVKAKAQLLPDQVVQEVSEGEEVLA